MSTPLPQLGVLRFGTFELNPESGELRKAGTLVKLQPQPFKVLALLAARAGQVVTREELRAEIWGKETFVDFEHGLNYCIQQIRLALGDDAGTPRYVETMPRRGYRFVAPVERVEPSPAGTAPAGTFPRRPIRSLTRPAILVAFALGLVLAATFYLSREQPWSDTRASKRRIMLVVLPFVNLSGDAEQEYFSDGLTEEMITELGRLDPQRLGVIARTSAMKYRDGARDLRRVAQDLGVDYVLEGSVLREGDRVRVNAQLIQTRDQTQLWSVSYEQDLHGIIALQNEVAQAVAREVELKLTPQQQARLGEARLVNPQAHEAYLKGLYFWNKFTVEGFNKGITYFQQALERDPNYAPAYAGLGACYSLLGHFQVLPPEEAYPKSKAAAERAIQLDPTVSFAHSQLAFDLMFYDHDWAGAEREFQRAIELNPSNANAHEGYAAYFAARGQHDRAWEEIQRARQIDPLSLVINADVGLMLYLARDYDRALAHLQRTLELDPNFPPTYWDLAHVYQAKGMHQEAVTAGMKLVALAQGDSPRVTKWATGVQKAFDRSGWKGAWQKRLEMDQEWQSQGIRVPAYDFAVADAALGDKQKAIASLEKAVDERYWEVVFLGVDPQFDSLRDEPRFQELLRRIGLPP